MKRKGWPLWLLRDIPAFLGVMLSFWPLVILMITSVRRAARGKKVRRSVFEAYPGLVAHAEARLVFALTRQAYRRLGWNPRLVRFNLIPATDNWDDTDERCANYLNAFRDMERVVDAYLEDIRRRYRIAERDLVAHGATDAALCAAAHHELLAASPCALILSSARRARPSKDAHGHTHARGPPPNLTHTQEPSTSHVNVRDCFAMPTAC